MATSVSKLLIRLQKFSSKISTTVDATTAFNSGGWYIQDLSGWDSAVVQFVSPSEEITFFNTNDNGSITGQLLPAPQVVDNLLPVQGVDLATKTDVLSTSADSMIEFGIVGQYLVLLGATIDNFPHSYAYVLSKNTYNNAGEAYNVGVLQGTRIVYTTTGILNGANILYTDSRLTEPVLGDGSSWYGVQLLTDTAVKYAITINSAGEIFID
jgi:hypothetical protein